jgi:hypothetical protein
VCGFKFFGSVCVWCVVLCCVVLCCVLSGIYSLSFVLKKMKHSSPASFEKKKD